MEASFFSTVFFTYLIGINLFTFVLYGLDKYKAVHGLWRVSERVLLLAALLGGAFSALFAMFFFHHKTRKARFLFFIPLCTLIWGILILRIYLKWS